VSCAPIKMSVGRASVFLLVLLLRCSHAEEPKILEREVGTEREDRFTLCGFNATQSKLPCAPGCPRVSPSNSPLAGVCVPSCGFPCESDPDCGTWPDSNCYACVEKTCRGGADFSQCARSQPDRQARKRTAPVLPLAWNATMVFVNETDRSTGYGKMWYDDRFGPAIRQDWFPDCPLANLQGGSRANNVPCSVVFYRGEFAVRYPSFASSRRNKKTTASRCCAYKFPAWRPDVYRAANATFVDTVSIDFQEADYFAFQYTCPWIRPRYSPQMLPAYTVQRDVYFTHGTNRVVRMNETLTSGWTDFFDLAEGPQDERLFSDVMSGTGGEGACLRVSDVGEAKFLQQCIKYSGVGRMSFLGFA
jgi:hypothetical protein